MLLGAVAAAASVASAQEMVINGSFEDTTATRTEFNLTNAEFNALMADATAFGDDQEIDIMDADSGFGSDPAEGLWKVGLDNVPRGGGGGLDAIALHLSTPIIDGERYRLRVVAQSVVDFRPGRATLEFGVSADPQEFGVPLLTTPVLGIFGWQRLDLEFDAPPGTPAGATYLTMRAGTGDGAWAHIDLVSLRPSCTIDLDGDGRATVFDYLAYINLFLAGDPAADLDGDGDLTVLDFLAFQAAFDAGCE